jgi:hypothetical protein
MRRATVRPVIAEGVSQAAIPETIQGLQYGLVTYRLSEDLLVIVLQNLLDLLLGGIGFDCYACNRRGSSKNNMPISYYIK